MGHQSKDEATLLTAPGVAALAVVRIAGAGVAAFLAKRFDGRPVVGRAAYGRLSDDAGEIDDPVVTLITAPNGSAVADLSLHGGERVTTRTLQLLSAEGFMLESSVGSGRPMPEVAFLEAADDVERLVLRHLPMALTTLAADTLMAQIDAWRGFDAAAFARKSPDDAARMTGDEALWHLLHPPTVAIVGRANVGKSSLANRLAGRARSIVADRPGTTRDWVGGLVDLDGLTVRLIDTPGERDAGEAVDPIERQAIATAWTIAASADVRVRVIDAGRPADQASAGEIRFVNKSDRRATVPESTTDVLYGSALTGSGVERLRERIRSTFGIGDGYDPLLRRWWTVDQRQTLRGGSNQPTTGNRDDMTFSP